MEKFTRPVRKPLVIVLVCAVGAWLFAALGLKIYSTPQPPERPAVPPTPEDTREFFQRLKPALGEPAPDFTLRDVDGAPFTLSRESGKRPLVIEFGSFTCPLCLAGQSAAAEKLAGKYRDKATFVLVYCQEAHPEEDRELPVRSVVPGYEGLPLLTVTNTWGERAERAKLFRERAKVPYRILVDEMGDASVQQMYRGNGHQNALFVIDAHGTIVYRWELAPLAEVDAFLQAYLDGKTPPRPRRYYPLRPLVPVS
jgi:peroxiredoxin